MGGSIPCASKPYQIDTHSLLLGLGGIQEQGFLQWNLLQLHDTISPTGLLVKHGRIAGKSQSLLRVELSEVLRKGL